MKKIEITAKHTPGPWKVVPPEHNEREMNRVALANDPDWLIAYVLRDDNPNQRPIDEANAEFIVRACNCHEELLETCRAALSHVEELREAWQTGALSEHDGRGGTRSNRNVDVESQLRAAIAKTEGREA